MDNAVKRWYYEVAEEAYQGDVKMQALLGNMLMEGYGCIQDETTGKEWAGRARRRGYHMAGVYCTI